MTIRLLTYYVYKLALILRLQNYSYTMAKIHQIIESWLFWNLINIEIHIVK